MSLPQFLYRSNRSAIILPVFFYKNSQVLDHCSTIESCAYLCVLGSGLRRSSNSIEPSNKAELIECVNSFICYSNKNYLRTHVALETVFHVDVSHARMVFRPCRVPCVANSLLFY